MPETGCMTSTLPTANSHSALRLTLINPPPLARARPAATPVVERLGRKTLRVGRAISIFATPVEFRPVARPQPAPRVTLVPSPGDGRHGVLVAKGPAVAAIGAARAGVPLREGA